MNKSYQPWTQDQAYLLPPSLRDWLPEDHLAWFILDVVSQLDLSAIERAIQSKDARGQRPYHPSMMVALLVYAYCTGVYSSRRIERACHEDVAFRVMTGDAQPYFTTINEFRRVHREHFAALFVQVLKLCREAGLVKLRHVAKLHLPRRRTEGMTVHRRCGSACRKGRVFVRSAGDDGEHSTEASSLQSGGIASRRRPGDGISR